MVHNISTCGGNLESKRTGQVNSTGNLATRSDGASNLRGVGVTHNGCTDDEEEYSDNDDDGKEAEEEGMDDVCAWLRHTRRVALHVDLDVQRGSQSQPASGWPSWSNVVVDVSKRTWNTPEPDTWRFTQHYHFVYNHFVLIKVWHVNNNSSNKALKRGRSDHFSNT